MSPMNPGMTKQPSRPKKPARVERADAPTVETPEAPNTPTLEPLVAADGMSVKMPEGHTVHLDKRHPSVDANRRSTESGEMLTSSDEQG